ncbi:MAG: methylated-DNA--[protein]-cysteine S-methyltransferase [Alphaproteobacteria bacterium]|nr:methylated-DNA--[protein]-cysteine S-methyltransferase [Alphaproteobacteria bacterium]
MNIPYFSTTMQSPLGDLRLTSNGQAMTGVYMSTQQTHSPAENASKECSILQQAKRQLNEYFSGQRHHFELPLAPSGTEFQQRVWKALCTISYGQTVSYQYLANLVGNPKGCRAVGLANSKNPISIIIPCHRVIGTNGKLTGYAGGLDNKKWLLEREVAAATFRMKIA